MSLNPGLAKTSHPKLSGVLARERLFNLLDQRRRGSGIWIKAGAGCGKTTLVASYLSARGLDSCWYHLDSRDSDVATFFYYMSRAAGKSYSPALPLFTPEYHDELPSFARRFFQVLFEASSPSFVLVLDDYHEVSLQSPLHGVVESAIAETPPDVCVIVISRSEPPPSMARLRANRRLEVVGWEELRLTRQESDAIINKWGRNVRRACPRTSLRENPGLGGGARAHARPDRDRGPRRPGCRICPPGNSCSTISPERSCRASMGRREICC